MRSSTKMQTKREKFLAEMEAVVPWAALIISKDPPYPKLSKKGGRSPSLTTTRPSIHLLFEINGSIPVDAVAPDGDLKGGHLSPSQ